MDDKRFAVTHTDEEWRRLLTREQYQVLRGHGTEAPGHVHLRRLRPTAVRIEEEIRERHGLAELQRPGRGCGRKLDRSKLWHGAHRGALQPLRQPSRPRVQRRAPADESALLHQRRGHEL